MPLEEAQDFTDDLLERALDAVETNPARYPPDPDALQMGVTLQCWLDVDLQYLCSLFNRPSALGASLLCARSGSWSDRGPLKIDGAFCRDTYKPAEAGKLYLDSTNKVNLESIAYDYSFGPMRDNKRVDMDALRLWSEEFESQLKLVEENQLDFDQFGKFVQNHWKRLGDVMK